MTTIKTIGVIGAGQMGAGIAQVAARSGFSTLLWDAQSAALDKGMAGIRDRLKKAVEKALEKHEKRPETIPAVEEAWKAAYDARTAFAAVPKATR